jgi:Xaa-Pro dipeptidase
MSSNAPTAAPAVAPIAERDARYARLREAFASHELDGLLVYVPGWRREDARYLADAQLRGSFALIHLPLDGEPTAFTLPVDRVAVAAAGWVTDVRALDLSASGTLSAAVRGAGLGPSTIGVAQLELMPVAVRAWLQTELADTRLISATRLLSAVRLVKSELELQRMRRCGELTDAGWEAFVAAMRPGRSEYEIVAEVEARMKAMGATDNFMLIASGGDEVRGMTPPSARRLGVGDMVRTELTPQVDGYWTQICRSAVLGAASDGQRASHELFAAALDAGLSALRGGVTAHDVAMAENDVFRAAGYGEYCTAKHTRVRGHGLGAHFDEVPLVEGEETVLETGAVVIVHPNTYTPLAGYHVLGDPVIVTPTGWEPLLSTTRELFEVAG